MEYPYLIWHMWFLILLLFWDTLPGERVDEVWTISFRHFVTSHSFKKNYCCNETSENFQKCMHTCTNLMSTAIFRYEWIQTHPQLVYLNIKTQLSATENKKHNFTRHETETLIRVEGKENLCLFMNHE